MKITNNTIYKGYIFVQNKEELLMYDNLFLISKFKIFYREFYIYINKHYLNGKIIEELFFNKNNLTLWVYNYMGKYMKVKNVGKFRDRDIKLSEDNYKIKIETNNSVEDLNTDMINDFIKNEDKYKKHFIHYRIKNIDIFKNLINKNNKPPVYEIL